mmetsp:Transcript_20311/g.41397  ORF Transcript_20311/g.41397 Transcript_20311/m.41397 type:complete len:88 (-) Transcript_20311:6-269(-)
MADEVRIAADVAAVMLEMRRILFVVRGSILTRSSVDGKCESYRTEGCRPYVYNVSYSQIHVMWSLCIWAAATLLRSYLLRSRLVAAM